MRWAEVAPLTPVLIPLGEVLLWAVALAVCYAVVYFAKAFFGLAEGTLGKIPVLGGWINSGIRDVERKIVATMSGAAQSVDEKLGAALHELGRIIDWVGREIARHANLLELIAGLLAGTAGVGFVAAAVGRLLGRLHALEANAEHAISRVFGNEQRVARGIGNDVLPRIRSLDREISRVLEPEIAGLRAGERALEHGAIKTWDWILRHPKVAASTAFAGAVAWALARLGAGWVRCSNWNKIGRQVCGTPTSEIEGLLGLFVAGVSVLELRELVKLAQSVEKVTAQGIQDLLGV